MRPETAIQRAIYKHLTALGYFVVHVPNGAVLGGDKAKRARQMNALKADGLRVGFPDLIVYGPQGRIGHIEIKTPKGKQSDSQLECQSVLESLRQRYVVCTSIDEVDAAIASWGWGVATGDDVV